MITSDTKGNVSLISF